MFVTWRLWGSLPQERSFLPEHLTSGEAFVALDRLLDTARLDRSTCGKIGSPGWSEIICNRLWRKGSVL